MKCSERAINLSYIMRIQNTAILLVAHLLSLAQFTDITNSTGIILTGNTLQSGSGVSFYDFDHDGDDDLTLGGPFEPIVAWRNDNGTLVPAHFFDNTGDPKSIMWIDYDNDGDSDLFFSVYNQSAKLFRNEGSDVFVNVTDSLHLPAINAKTFGCAWGDYDKDGYLDVYLSNYNLLPTGPTNWLLRNNGNGGFINVTAAMGVSNSTKRTYQSSWIDFNLDGWLDLFVANDFNDGNELYINTGNGFIASGAQYGLNTAMEGMSSSWSDFDSDGDFDGYISNNMPGNKLFRNDGDTAVDIAPLSGTEVNALCWGTLWLDFDHDGHDDLHVCTTIPGLNNNQNYLLRNNGDYTFSDTSMTNDVQSVYGSAKGDINNDGWWDIIEMKMQPAAIGLWQNNGGAHRWLKFHLQGVTSNRDAVGSIVRYYYPGKSGMLQTYCGEGYMGQDSQHEIISMADHETLDSIIIQWPSGWEDRYYNLNSNTSYTFIEGETYNPVIEAQKSFVCENDSIWLTVNDAQQVTWFNSVNNDSIYVYAPGTYSATVENEWGIIKEIQTTIEEGNAAVANINVQPPSCSGQSDACVGFETDDYQDWNLNGVNAQIQNCGLTPGLYTLTYIGAQFCYTEQLVQIEDADSILVTATAPLSCGAEPVELALSISGINGEYDIVMNDGSDPAALIPGFYEGQILTQSGCAGPFNVEVVQVPAVHFIVYSDTLCTDAPLSLTYEITGGQPGFITDWQGNNPMLTTAGEYFAIVIDQNDCRDTAHYTVYPFNPVQAMNSVSSVCPGSSIAAEIDIIGGYPPIQMDWGNVNTDSLTVGVYPIEIQDAAGCIVTTDFTVNEYPAMQLNVWVTYPTDSLPGTAELLVTGGVSPYSYSWNNLPGEAIINWLDSSEYIILITDSAGCTIHDTLELTTTKISENTIRRNIPYPNPMNDILNIEVEAISEIQLLNSVGQVLFSKREAKGKEAIHTAHLTEGVYFLHICNERSKTTYKIVKRK